MGVYKLPGCSSLEMKTAINNQLLPANRACHLGTCCYFCTMLSQKFTPNQALPKIKQFCAYQERCHSEVKEKLYQYGLGKNDVEEIISKLIEDNYLNEERFAIHFAGGKFR